MTYLEKTHAESLAYHLDQFTGRAARREHTRRRAMLDHESPPGECHVTIHHAGQTRTLKFSHSVYWRFYDTVDQEIQRAKDEMSEANQ